MVGNGSDTAPIRAAARVATTNRDPWGSRIPTWLPLPTPAASNPRATSTERRSASA
jgi:hypothetical protein